MNLKELKEAIDNVYASNNNPEKIEVCIPNNQSSYGGTSVTSVRSAHKGIDWDRSKFFIHPSIEMIENPTQKLT